MHYYYTIVVCTFGLVTLKVQMLHIGLYGLSILSLSAVEYYLGHRGTLAIFKYHYSGGIHLIVIKAQAFSLDNEMLLWQNI